MSSEYHVLRPWFGIVVNLFGKSERDPLMAGGLNTCSGVVL